MNIDISLICPEYAFMMQYGFWLRIGIVSLLVIIPEILHFVGVYYFDFRLLIVSSITSLLMVFFLGANIFWMIVFFFVLLGIALHRFLIIGI